MITSKTKARLGHIFGDNQHQLTVTLEMCVYDLRNVSACPRMSHKNRTQDNTLLVTVIKGNLNSISNLEQTWGKRNKTLRPNDSAMDSSNF